MRRVQQKLLLALLAVVMVASLALVACGVPTPPVEPPTIQAEKLATPKVTLDENNVASWQAVEHAVEYQYKFGNGQPISTTELSVKVPVGQSFVVRAVGDNVKYATSSWSLQVAANANKLATPVVTLDGSVASWQQIYGAVEYLYKINNGQEFTTKQLNVTLSEGESVQVMAVGDGVNNTSSNWSSVVTYQTQTPQPTQLATPVVALSDDGVASWQAVANADGYEYKINNGQTVTTTKRSVTLFDGESLQVKAIGNGVNYISSDWSSVVTYHAQPQPTQLATPVVTISASGIASWQAVNNAVSYEYKIDNGQAVTTTQLSVQLLLNQSITVRAKGDNANFVDSKWSQAVTYQNAQDCNHVDSNDNGACDSCNTNLIETINFIGVNDLHGKYMDSDSQPGLDEFTTWINDKYNDNAAHEVLLSQGDMWQGTAEIGLTFGALMTDWMNHVGFVSMALGNHEFDWGDSYIADNAQIAEFPFLGINVYNKQTGKRMDYCQPSVVVERGGVKIGIIGAMGDCLSSISGDFSANLDFKVGSELTKLVQDEAKRLRDDGCKFIVYTWHSDKSDFDSAISNKNSGKGYVDIVFEGHSHQDYVTKDANGVYHLQTSGYNDAISSAYVKINKVTGTFQLENVNNIYNSTYASSTIKGDDIVKQLLDEHLDGVDPYQPLGYNSSLRSSSQVRAMVAQLYVQLGVETWGSKYNIVAGGGYLNTRDPYDLSAGIVDYAQLYALLPFNNDIVLGRISGSKLKQNFVNSSRYTTYWNNFNSSSIVDSNYYYIIVDSYTSTYSYNQITEIARLGTSTYARDLLAEYVSTGGWGTYNLKTPDVKVDVNGLATWDKVLGALNYQITITNNASSVIKMQTGTTFQLNANDTITVKALGNQSLLDSSASKAISYVPASEGNPIKLTAPTISIDIYGTISWSAIEGASAYLVNVGGNQIRVEQTSYKLGKNLTATVKAVGNQTTYLDSDYSNSVSYVVNTIAEAKNLGDNTECLMSGVVCAVAKTGYLFQDNSGASGANNYLFVYNPSTSAEGLSVGDQIIVKGKMGTYGGQRQVAAGSTYFKESTSSVTPPQAHKLTASEVDAMVANISSLQVGKYVEVTGSLTINGNYYNVKVNGATHIVSFVSPITAIPAGNVTVRGYLVYVTKGSSVSYVYMIVDEVM